MNRRFALLQAAFSIVALAAVVWWASHQDAPHVPSSGSAIAWLVAGLAVYGLATLVRGERWHQILHLTGVEARRSDCYALTTVGYMGNNVLPARAGEALRVVLLDARVDAGKRRLLGTIVAERLLDVVVLATLFVVLAFGALQGIEVPEGGRVALGLALVGGVVAVAAAGWWTAQRSGRAERLHTFMAPMLAALTRLRGRHLTEVLTLSLVVWGIEVVGWWTVGIASGLDVNLLEAAFILALSSMIVLIPSGPGYAGTLDVAIVLATQALGRSASAGLSYLLLLRFVIMVPITAAGFLVLLVRYGGRRGLAEARS